MLSPDYDENGLPVALPETLLPVRLPEMTDFRPEPQADESQSPGAAAGPGPGLGGRRARSR